MLDNSDRQERRRLTRCRRRFRISITVNAEEMVGLMIDISVCGVGILCPQELRPGSPISIELPHAWGTSPQKLLAGVRHATEHPDGGWVIGCQLLELLTVDAIMQIR
ncbi:hypothetical protein BH10PLA2_BH10PLA2_19480 [soil metagenome]